VGLAHHQMLADIALSTGAELVSSLRGFSPGSLQSSWLGTARQIVLKRDSFTVLEGGGDAARIQERVRDIREQIARSLQPDDTARLRERLASLAGGIGILQIGGLTQAERDDKRRNVERVLRVLPELVKSGVVPGGGIALLACRSALQEHRASFGSGEERFGVDIMSRALEAPFLQLVTNCNGMEPEVALQRVTESDYRLAFDAHSGALVPSSDAEFTDSLAVMRGAFRIATSAVSELITTGTAVLPKERNRPVSTEP
jgi:chaperonin GroEL